MGKKRFNEFQKCVIFARGVKNEKKDGFTEKASARGTDFFAIILLQIQDL